MTTYTGPTVSPVFVTGVINDAWDQARERTLTARGTVEDLNPTPIVPKDLAELEAPDDLTIELPGLVKEKPGAGPALVAALSQMMRTFMASHFPPVVTPDGAAIWERIARTFDSAPLAAEVLRMRGRIDSTWAARGLAPMPSEAREYLLREHDREAELIADGSIRNQELIFKTHRKDVDLTGYEIAFKAYLDALEAAKAYLIGCLLAALSKVREDQTALARFKDEMQTAFYRQLNALVEANSLELDRMILRKRIPLDADLSFDDRRAFVFKELVQSALDELQSVASQATAALNRISADATVSGRESTP